MRQIYYNFFHDAKISSLDNNIYHYYGFLIFGVFLRIYIKNRMILLFVMKYISCRRDVARNVSARHHNASSRHAITMQRLRMSSQCNELPSHHIALCFLRQLVQRFTGRKNALYLLRRCMQRLYAGNHPQRGISFYPNPDA